MPEASVAAEEPKVVIQECCGVCMLRYQYMAAFNWFFYGFGSSSTNTCSITLF